MPVIVGVSVELLQEDQYSYLDGKGVVKNADNETVLLDSDGKLSATNERVVRNLFWYSFPIDYKIYDSETRLGRVTLLVKPGLSQMY